MIGQPKIIKVNYYSSHYFPENRDTSYMGFSYKVLTYQPFHFGEQFVINENFMKEALTSAERLGDRFINFTIVYYETDETEDFTKEEMLLLISMKELVS